MQVMLECNDFHVLSHRGAPLQYYVPVKDDVKPFELLSNYGKCHQPFGVQVALISVCSVVLSWSGRKFCLSIIGVWISCSVWGSVGFIRVKSVLKKSVKSY